MLDIQDLLALTVENKASDLHLMVGVPPTFRVDGVLRPHTAYPALKPEDIEPMVFSLFTPEQKERELYK